MRTYFKIAWRNIWRVRNRTFITTFAILIAVFLSVIMRGFQFGSYDLMMKNAVENYSGYIQIHKNGYWEDKVIDNVFNDTDSLRKAVSETENVSVIIPQVNYSSLAAYELQSKGVIITGIVPSIEEKRMKLSDKIIQGSYLTENDDGVLIAENLAKYLKIETGDTLVLRSNGYHGVSADGIFPVRGIIKLPAPDLNSVLIVMDLVKCQYFFDINGMVTEYCINIDDLDKIDETKKALQDRLPDKYEVMAWYEIRPELMQQIESDNASGVIFLGLLYLIIAFGVFGTIMMMTMERRKEFGVMVAIGMRKTSLAKVLVIETMIIGFMGIVLGLLCAIPVNFYYHI
ncbi:MAG: FtsX-like permease family protein, partial [Bacteroidota bacterium]